MGYPPGYRDKGANGSVRYRLSTQTAEEHPGLFHVGEVGGEVTVLKSLDRETREHYTIGVVAYDLGTIISLSSEV